VKVRNANTAKIMITTPNINTSSVVRIHNTLEHSAIILRKGRDARPVIGLASVTAISAESDGVLLDDFVKHLLFHLG
jgi:hypothetical protein